MRCLHGGLLCFLFSGSALWGSAQNMTAPYSVYGIGEIERHTYHNGGMGFTGIGLKSSFSAFGTNPASVAGLPANLLLLQGSGAGRRNTYSGEAINSSNRVSKDFAIKNLSLSTKLNKAWGSSFGFRQLSYVGYQFDATKQVEGTADSYPLKYSGDGGLYDFYWNNAVNIGKHFSVGATASFIAGPINQTESMIDESGNTYEVKRRDYYGNFRLQTGALYTADISKKWTLGLGAQFAPRSPLNYERSYSLSQNSTALFTDTAFSFHKKYMAQSWGAGISLSSKGGTTWAADYTADDWSGEYQGGNGWRLRNSSRVALGVEFATENDRRGATVFRKAFQLGAFYQRNYQQVSGTQITGYGITGGLSRLLKNGFMYAINMEGGSRGTIANGLIRENYLQLSVHLSFRDFILSKGRRYD